ncbi:MAG: ferritin-like domain-containing protein [Polyangiaceae bacterium]|nr:ferritin-like domain-containing protein [Polyangiaceae bacterium]
MSDLLNLRQEARARMPAVVAPPHLRKATAQTWRARMRNEYGSAHVFEGLADQLKALGQSAEIVAEVERFALEERKHGALCGAVVEAMEEEAVTPPLESTEYPTHPEVSLLEGTVRNLLSICCLSETVAVALIGAERLEMPDGPLKTLLTEIYGDECGHSNFGWRLLPTLLEAQEVDEALIERLGRYLRVAFAHLEKHELMHLPDGPPPPPEGAALGLCSGRDARKLFYATVTRLIVPGLESHGLPARHAWENRCFGS